MRYLVTQTTSVELVVTADNYVDAVRIFDETDDLDDAGSDVVSVKYIGE